MDLYIYTGHACRHLPSAVPWISEYRLLFLVFRRIGEYISLELFYSVNSNLHEVTNSFTKKPEVGVY